MFSNRVFQAAFILSLAFHSALLVGNPQLFNPPPKQKEKNLEVSYIKEVPKPIQHTKSSPSRQEPLLRIPSKITADKRPPPPFIDQDKEIIGQKKKILSSRVTLEKPAFLKPDIIAIKKKITLPSINIDKINNPSYISYYQIVREKIKRAAYQNYTRNETGEVYLAFIISNDGYVKDVRLMEEKSSGNAYLREIASRSVRDASPFPNFPKELDYQQLTFNVVISFEIE